MSSAYVCVYRHFFPPPKAIAATRQAAANDRELLRFIDDYVAGRSYYDWGDDPSFFSAERHQGGPEFAGWGVCRPNVRAALVPGDLVVFFCAKRPAPRTTTTDYFFIGAGLVDDVVHERERLWRDEKFRPFRSHYNILARYSASGGSVQHETFYPYHDNWRHRLASPYVTFADTQSRFNLRTPLQVGASDGGKSEIWRSHQVHRVAQLEDLLFKRLGVARRLRTSSTGSAHPHINLTSRLPKAGINITSLREALLELV